MPVRTPMDTTYTLTQHPNTVVRDEDGAFIPTDPDNIDYQDYLAWLDEGNTPTPYSQVSAAKKETTHHNYPEHRAPKSDLSRKTKRK